MRLVLDPGERIFYWIIVGIMALVFLLEAARGSGPLELADLTVPGVFLLLLCHGRVYLSS